jgi:hypothetical protein
LAEGLRGIRPLSLLVKVCILPLKELSPPNKLDPDPPDPNGPDPESNPPDPPKDPPKDELPPFPNEDPPNGDPDPPKDDPDPPNDDPPNGDEPLVLLIGLTVPKTSDPPSGLNELLSPEDGDEPPLENGLKFEA